MRHAVPRPLGPLIHALALPLALTACSGGAGPDDPAPAEPPAPQPPSGPVEEPAPPLAPAPWSARSLGQDGVPAPYLQAWRAADNRGECALLAFESSRVGEDAPAGEPRTAHFGGGWGVAYDIPGLRSAFGVAGTGVRPGPDTYDDWPYRREWRDGSRAGWGPEGGSGPKQLAYLRVAGQECLYNVWSHLGPRHLERLIEELRRVQGAP